MPRIKWLLLGLSVLLLVGYWQMTNTNYGRLEALLARHKQGCFNVSREKLS